MLDQATARRKLQEVRDIFTSSLGAYALLTEEPSKSQLSEFNIKFDDGGRLTVSRDAIPATPGISYNIGFNYGMDVDSAKAVVEHTFRYMVLQSFEITKKYAPLTSKDQPWYNFAFNYRNAISHDGHWKLTNKTMVPATWRRYTVDLHLDGQSIDDYFSWYHGMQLCGEMALFVEPPRR